MKHYRQNYKMTKLNIKEYACQHVLKICRNFIIQMRWKLVFFAHLGSKSSAVPAGAKGGSNNLSSAVLNLSSVLQQWVEGNAGNFYDLFLFVKKNN